MAVTKNIDREVCNIQWDPTVVGTAGDLVDIVATNPDTGEESDRKQLVNDGFATFTYPLGFIGTTHFEVTGPLGTESGDVAVGLGDD